MFAMWMMVRAPPSIQFKLMTHMLMDPAGKYMLRTYAGKNQSIDLYSKDLLLLYQYLRSEAMRYVSFVHEIKHPVQTDDAHAEGSAGKYMLRTYASKNLLPSVMSHYALPNL